MQNFGRGMWRRVGDFERLHAPQLLQQQRIEQWMYFREYQRALKIQQARKELLEKKLKLQSKTDNSETDNKS